MVKTPISARRTVDAKNPETALNPEQPLRVIFCWAEVAGYMAACWRALTRCAGLDVHILHPQRLFGRPNPFHRDPLLLEGISNEMFDSEARDVDQVVFKAVADRRPQILVVCGWFYRPYNRLIQSSHLGPLPVVLGMDSPWRATFRQRFARFRLARLVKHFDLVVTSGERSSEYARRVGVTESRIRTGFYGCDYQQFSAAASQRQLGDGKWPRQFLFVGRYVPQKDLPTLVKAYAQYRRSVSDPWGLTCCGAGEEREWLNGAPGVVDAGFTPPRDLPKVFSRHGAFVLPSRVEPWGVVIAEAAASGLPVICSTACGAGLDIVRPYYNGIAVAPGDVAGLARALRWFHEHESELPRMGQCGQALAEAYSAEAWATRWHNYFLELAEESTPRMKMNTPSAIFLS